LPFDSRTSTHLHPKGCNYEAHLNNCHVDAKFNGTSCSLAASDSTLHLVYAAAINDSGMIAGIGVPPGVSDGDVETLGHAYVLIPEVDFSQAAPTALPLNAIQAPGSALEMKRATADLIQHIRNHRTGRLPFHP
jgi:hypothetical protein